MRLGVRAALVDDEFTQGDVDIHNGFVTAVGLSARGGQGIAAPGFVDLHVNGFAGIDFAEADEAGYRHAGQSLLATGVTAFQPTFMTAPEQVLIAGLQALPRTSIGPIVLGAHLEGPFVSPERLGAHPADSQRAPDSAMLGRLLSAGPVSQVTLAPELPGVLALIEMLVARDVIVSLGHSDATADEAARAFEAGATTVTHLFNAMRPSTPRDPGLAVSAIAHQHVYVQMIVDGQHVAPELVVAVWRATTDRFALVTDAVAAAGMEDGDYRLGGVVGISLRGGAVRDAHGVLAGSTLTMLDAVRNMQTYGVPLESALNAASRVPAGILRRSELGRIRPGAPANIVVLSDELDVVRTLVQGSEYAF